MHIISHEQILQAMLLQSKPTSHYPLDYDEKDDRWKEVHALEHDGINQLLGINPTMPNLSDVDFKDPAQFDNWMYNHAMVHQQIKTALGL